MEENNITRESLIEKYGFNESDFLQIKALGISLDKIESELLIFQLGLPKINLVRPAIVDDGILKLTTDQFQTFATFFDKKKEVLKLKKFVPASGAATRMFKFLIQFLNEFDPEKETVNAYINRKKVNNLTIFLAGIEKFPFYEEIKTEVKKLHPNYYSLESHEKSYHFIKVMLSQDHFNFANKPKGVLKFHKYEQEIATPIEEHLNESANYACTNSISHLHFTVSENHEILFKDIVQKVKGKIEDKTKSKFEVTYSFQDKNTDTIAVTAENLPFRNEKGQLVFRPGGHGALINNLNALNADIIFIKNIDNVIQNHIDEITLYKKGLAGILVNLQDHIFNILRSINSNEVLESDLPEIVDFMSQKLNITILEAFSKFSFENKLDYIVTKLNTPIRVCGMVKNEGEPGGGPFWVRSYKGDISLQIVESSQIDSTNSEQADILKRATHFNPVDLVCGVKNFSGEKFNLTDFVDSNTGFIVHKNNKGKELKGYELPGLWNGAMANWISVFVEVPLVTFNPVKTINDLLKPAHQPPNEE